MAMIPELKALFGEWIAAVARAVNSMIDRYVRRRQILLSEGGDNTFTAKVTPGRKGPALPDVSFRLSHGRPNPSLPADWQTTLRGSRVEVLLASRQVLFRSLDFPKQAVGFLDGMIRAQIDRLMPWAVDVPRILRVVLLSAGLAAAASLIVAAYIGSTLDAEQEQIQRRISQRRASLRLDPNAAGGSALNLLTKRKQTTPSSVMVLEALSQALPDSTYVTELRIEGDKVQVVGMTQDAPSLIRLMERSPQFARATFFAPTTRAQNDPGERFHLEAHITPSFGSGT